MCLIAEILRDIIGLFDHYETVLDCYETDELFCTLPLCDVPYYNCIILIIIPYNNWYSIMSF